MSEFSGRALREAAKPRREVTAHCIATILSVFFRRMRGSHELKILVQRLNNALPIIRRMAAHPWENAVTLNPACALVSDRRELEMIVSSLPFDRRTKEFLLSFPALCFLLYRAQGKQTKKYDFRRSSIGLAVLTPDLKLLARHRAPVILPDRTYDNLGVEDPRITKVGDRYVMVYTAYAAGEPKNRIRIALASSRDFVHWTKHGLLKGSFNTIDNKNGMLFEGRIGGKLVVLHRPMEGRDAMSIHWATANDLLGEWKSRGVLMKPLPNPPFVDTWIGGGAPPMSLSGGRFLFLYHIGNRAASGSKRYDLGLAVGDFSRTPPVIRRIEPVLKPRTEFERTGDAELGVSNVAFVCGSYFYEGDLYFPYAGADSVILGGKIPRKALEGLL